MDYRKAGYTHEIKYETVHETFGVVKQSFPTVADAVDFWVNTLRSNSQVFNIEVVSLTEEN